MSALDAALELSHVSVRFGARRVIDDVSVTFSRGETTAVVGRSGAGKSVLLKAACDLLPADGVREGEVFVGAAPLVFVHQDPALLDDLDVLENIAFAVSRTALPSREVSRRVDEAMRALELLAVRHVAPARLPLATQKRVAIARALALAPGVLIVDEPTTGLDPIAADIVDGALVAIARARTMTLVVITHSPRTLTALAPRVVVVEHGRTRAIGWPSAPRGAEARP